ncbi:hypothetical protein [Haloarchaeobius sp. HRN-SO-5]|uniref:hypothetical protein n=1 Tax=Haloarchaeobius sp. HRN-SO-5 TaxID=3446118 RepID=UPI003EBE7035
MAPREYDLLELEAEQRTVSLLPASFATENGAGVLMEWVSTATAESPACLRATLTNHNEFRAKFRTRSVPPFDRVAHSLLRDHTSSESSIYLAPTASHPLVDGEPAYERRPSGHWGATRVPPKQPSSIWLDPEESVTGEYYLLGGVDSERLLTGRYRFASGASRGGFSLAVWDTDRPGPVDEPRFAGLSLPSLVDSVKGRFPGSVSWFHDADGKTDVYLEPTAESAEIPGRIDFTLVNRSDHSLVGNPLCWSVLKRHDGRWFHVAPSGFPQPRQALPPGETRTDALRVFADDPVPCDDGHDVGHLGGGSYAFTVGSYDGTEYAAAFDLRGDAVEVTPTDAVEIVTLDEGSLTARSTRGVDDGTRLWRYTISRADRPEESVTRPIAEQVLRRQPLRDALGLLLDHDVARVTVEEFTDSRPPFGIGDAEYVEYEGTCYRISTVAADDAETT